MQSFSKRFALCSGALAGSITGVATTPLDVIKTRLMTQGSKRTYSGVIDCARKIGQEEGYATFLQVHADKSEKQSQHQNEHVKSLQCCLARAEPTAVLGIAQAAFHACPFC